MMEKEEKMFVAASNISSVCFCPHSLELQLKGTPPSLRAKMSREKGTQQHESFNRKFQDKRCYIATEIYGADHPRTQLLRDFRDKSLLPTRGGALFTVTYYKLSPLIISVTHAIPAASPVFKNTADWIVRRILKDKYDG